MNSPRIENTATKASKYLYGMSMKIAHMSITDTFI
jgi:hypothetical protein